jgi:hypothetical protein
MKKENIAPFFATLQAANPTPETELEYATPFELLAAVLLSAQATDVGVNKATRKLFPVANTPQAILRLGVEGLEDYIKTIGLYRSKAKHLIATCRILVEQHGGEVPRTRAELEALPGGRPQDRQRGAQCGVRRGDDRGRHAHLPRWQPHRARAGQDAARSGAQAGEAGAFRVPPARAPLAHLAWALHLRGTHAEVLGVRGGAVLRLQAEDAAAQVGLNAVNAA